MKEETKLFKCSICSKEFKSLGSLGAHLGHHSRNGEIPKREHKKSHCINGVYICECSREFTNKQSFVAHCGHCEIHLGYKPKWRGANINDWWNSLKEEDPEKFHYLHSKAGINSVKSAIEKYGMNCLSKFSSTPSKRRDESYKKQSETRKRKYRSGELNIARTVGKFVCSYVNGIFIRSSYEAVYSLYLSINKMKFRYESVRVIGEDNRTYISDFELEDGSLVEVKGVTKRIPDIKSAFESNGYKIRFITSKEIDEIKSYLRGIIDVDRFLDVLKSEHKNKNIVYWKINDKGEIAYSIYGRKDNPSIGMIPYSSIIHLNLE